VARGDDAFQIVLREAWEPDLPVFFEHQLDPEATRMAAFPSRPRDAFFAHWRKIMADPNVVLRTVLVDGRVAGNVVSFRKGDAQEVGYWLGREFWGRGIATRALTLFLAEARARPLHAHVAKRNVASIRVLEKCRFRVVGETVEERVMRLG
jgi:RimJ/RimL family protein N-acetyltransferase